MIYNYVACGGNFFTPEGFIMSPNFPDDYPTLMYCKWTINVPVSNQIELNITQFHLEETHECEFDFIEIRYVRFKFNILFVWQVIIIHFYRNGRYSSSPLIGKYCGSKIIPIISSAGNSLFIKFVSDGSLGFKGFFIQWYLSARGIYN